jgi:hypothetical protein
VAGCETSICHDHHLPVCTPILCCNPWNICGGCFPAAAVRRQIFSFIFNFRFWVEATPGEDFLPNYRQRVFPGVGSARATTRQSSAGSRLAAGSVAGVNENHSAHRQNAGAGNCKKSNSCETPPFI